MDGDDRCDDAMDQCLIVRSAGNQFNGYLDLLVFQMRLPGPLLTGNGGGILAWELVIPKSTTEEPVYLYYSCDGSDTY